MTDLCISTFHGDLCEIPLEGLDDDGEPFSPDCRPVPCDGRGTMEWHVPEGTCGGYYRPQRKCRKALPDLRQQRCRKS